METEIINRVASSGLITINLEDYYHKGERVLFDLKFNLYQELILKEKDFRAFIKAHNWSDYQGKNVSIHCSADAIIPNWAYMLVVSKLVGIAHHVVVGDLDLLERSLFQQALNGVDLENYRNCKVVIKGCGELPIGSFAYGEITRILVPVVASLMYGEPCSTVPVFKSSIR